MISLNLSNFKTLETDFDWHYLQCKIVIILNWNQKLEILVCLLSIPSAVRVYVTTTELDAYLYFSAPALQAWSVFYCIIFTFCCECCLLNIWKFLANHYLYKQYTGIVLFTFVFSPFCVCMCVLQFLCIKSLLTNTVACLCYMDDLRENEHEEHFFFNLSDFQKNPRLVINFVG